jgi:peptidoglycan hydrolase CwlO-like protein
MKKIFLCVSLAVITVVSFLGCSVFDDMAKSHHESHATIVDLSASIDKVSDAVAVALPKVGMTANKVLDTVLEKEYKGDEINITIKKIEDKLSKIYIRHGLNGDTVKEAALLAEIKKQL